MPKTKHMKETRYNGLARHKIINYSRNRRAPKRREEKRLKEESNQSLKHTEKQHVNAKVLPLPPN